MLEGLGVCVASLKEKRPGERKSREVVLGQERYGVREGCGHRGVGALVKLGASQQRYPGVAIGKQMVRDGNWPRPGNPSHPEHLAPHPCLCQE